MIGIALKATATAMQIQAEVRRDLWGFGKGGGITEKDISVHLLFCQSKMGRKYFEDHREVVFDERKIACIVGRIEMQRLPRSLETDEYHINSLISRHGKFG
jgi:hypothetical protein